MLVNFNITYKTVLYLIVCFYFLLKRSDLQFMNSSPFWTNLSFKSHYNYYVIQHNFASHFCLMPVIVKTKPTASSWGAKNTNLYSSVATMGFWHLT